ncbi:hypothetical protein [Inediibacterium massiliense]|uniref:hypothetical protein n=1 Tax=Inediibacterium massiliense TaxID=1658111 RepID=UPI0006B50E1E|nr:hypothetical protein [Inediibacterium massiliense]
MKKILGLFVIIAVISTFFIQFETTSNKKINLEKEGIGDLIELSMIETDFDVIAYLVGNQDNKYHENNNLSFIDGLKNGFLVVASYFRDAIVGTICGYLSGFYGKGVIMKIVWAIFGVPIELIKNVITSFIGTIILMFQLLTQKGSFMYYIGYVLSLIIAAAITKRASVED